MNERTCDGKRTCENEHVKTHTTKFSTRVAPRHYTAVLEYVYCVHSCTRVVCVHTAVSLDLYARGTAQNDIFYYDRHVNP